MEAIFSVSDMRACPIPLTEESDEVVLAAFSGKPGHRGFVGDGGMDENGRIVSLRCRDNETVQYPQWATSSVCMKRVLKMRAQVFAKLTKLSLSTPTRHRLRSADGQALGQPYSDPSVPSSTLQ